MGFLSSFRRRPSHGATASETEGVNGSNGAAEHPTSAQDSSTTTSRKGKQKKDDRLRANGSNGQREGLTVKPAAVPQLDLDLGRPETPLIDLGGISNGADPWVDVAGEDEAAGRLKERGSLGLLLRAGPSAGTERDGNAAAEQSVTPGLRAALETAKLSPAQATMLIRACTRVLREQGVDALGLFRPWRLAESPYQICRALGLFLRAADPSGPHVPLEDRDFFGFGDPNKPSTVFEAVLNSIGVHNVASCLKWGLRHLRYGPGGFAGDIATSSPWAFYKTFLRKEEEGSYPRDAFTSLLLSALPQAQRGLLQALCDLIGLVSIHAEQNAMTGSHLCRLLGFWVFGGQQQEYKDVESLYSAYERSGSMLEHLFLSYLRSQSDLPLRLQELVSQYPPAHKADPATSKRSSIEIIAHADPEWQVILAGTVSSLAGDLATTSPRKPGARRRLPGAILASALQAEHPGAISNTLGETWRVLLDRAHTGDGVQNIRLANVVADESERIFGIIAKQDMLNRSSRKRRKWTLPSSEMGAPKVSMSQNSRRRSTSLDPAAYGHRQGGVTESAAHEKGVSLPNLSNAHTRSATSGPSLDQKTDKAVGARTSWGDFALTGFSESATQPSLSLTTEFGQLSPDRSPSPSSGPNKLKKPYNASSSSTRRVSGTRPAARNGSTAAEDLSDDDDEDPLLRRTKLESLQVIHIDPAFAEMYLDSLEDPLITSSWPTFVLAELDKSVIPPYRGLIVSENENSASKETGQTFRGSSAGSSPNGAAAEQKDAKVEGKEKSKGAAGGSPDKDMKALLDSASTRPSRSLSASAAQANPLTRVRSSGTATPSELGVQKTPSVVSSATTARKKNKFSTFGKRAKRVSELFTRHTSAQQPDLPKGDSIRDRESSESPEKVVNAPKTPPRPSVPIIVKTSPLPPKTPATPVHHPTLVADLPSPLDLQRSAGTVETSPHEAERPVQRPDLPTASSSSSSVASTATKRSPSRKGSRKPVPALTDDDPFGPASAPLSRGEVESGQEQERLRDSRIPSNSEEKPTGSAGPRSSSAEAAAPVPAEAVTDTKGATLPAEDLNAAGNTDPSAMFPPLETDQPHPDVPEVVTVEDAADESTILQAEGIRLVGNKPHDPTSAMFPPEAPDVPAPSAVRSEQAASEAPEGTPHVVEDGRPEAQMPEVFTSPLPRQPEGVSSTPREHKDKVAEPDSGKSLERHDDPQSRAEAKPENAEQPTSVSVMDLNAHNAPAETHQAGVEADSKADTLERSVDVEAQPKDTSSPWTVAANEPSAITARPVDPLILPDSNFVAQAQDVSASEKPQSGSASDTIAHTGVASPHTPTKNNKVLAGNESVEQNEGTAEGLSPTAEKVTSFSRTNKVSPSLKARFGGPFGSSNKSRTSLHSPEPSLTEQAYPDSPSASPTQTMRQPSRTKDSPPSPSKDKKTGKILANAKKILTRKSSKLPSDADSSPAATAPPLPDPSPRDDSSGTSHQIIASSVATSPPPAPSVAPASTGNTSAPTTTSAQTDRGPSQAAEAGPATFSDIKAENKSEFPPLEPSTPSVALLDGSAPQAEPSTVQRDVLEGPTAPASEAEGALASPEIGEEVEMPNEEEEEPRAAVPEYTPQAPGALPETPALEREARGQDWSSYQAGLPASVLRSLNQAAQQATGLAQDVLPEALVGHREEKEGNKGESLADAEEGRAAVSSDSSQKEV